MSSPKKTSKKGTAKKLKKAESPTPLAEDVAMAEGGIVEDPGILADAPTPETIIPISELETIVAPCGSSEPPMEITASQAAILVQRAFKNTSRPVSEIVNTIRYWYPDDVLVAPTDRDLVRVAKTIPTRTWTSEYDCDDFARTYYAKALEQRTDGKTWCVGLVNFEKTLVMKTPHRMNLAIVNYKGTPTVRVMEPQKTGSGAAANFLRKVTDEYVLRGCIFG